MGKSILILFILYFLLSPETTVSQQLNSKEKIELELAIQHYRKKEYEEAITYLEKIAGKPINPNVYRYLFQSYININDFKEAEKLVKKQIRYQPYDFDYKIDLGHLYSLSGDLEKSRDQFEEILKELPDNQHEIVRISNNFIALNELEYAEQTLLRGRKKNRDYPFNFELANVYYLLQNYELMINEYLDLLKENENYIQSVQNSLQSAITNSSEEEVRSILRQSLLRRIQKEAGRDVYSELLIWLYVQEKDFAGAFIQAKALDRRNSESGNRIVALARLSASNQDYETAVNCYQYVIDKGPESSRYQVARKGLVNVYNEK